MTTTARLHRRHRRASDEPASSASAGDVADVAAAPVVPATPQPPTPQQVRAARQREAYLLRSALVLATESLQRTIGALAVASATGRRPSQVDWATWLEQDVATIGELAVAVAASGGGLPAGFDCGRGDPAVPGSSTEGMVVAQEALLDVLDTLLEDAGSRHATWLPAVGALADRLQAQTTDLRRGLGPAIAPPDDTYRAGRPADRFAHPGAVG